MKIIESLKKRIFVLAYKHIDVTHMIEDVLVVNKNSISYFPFSYNSIKIIYKGDKVFFFRECLLHGDFHSRIDLCCEEFLEMLRGTNRIENFKQKIPLKINYSEEEIAEFESFLKLWRKEKVFYKEIINIEYYIKQSNFGIWKGNKSLSPKAKRKLAIPTCDNIHEDLFAYFLTFISSYIESWLFHNFLGSGNYETFFACRSLATYKLASVLGVDSLIPACKFVKLIIEGKSPSYGVLCEKAPGIRGLDCSAPVTPDLQRDLSKLSMLDALTYETDHFANNYNIVLCSSKASSICAFDNDSKWTFFPNFCPPRNTARNGSGLLNGNKVSLQYLDKEFAEIIMNVDRRKMNSIMSPYLNTFQIFALNNRLRLLQKSLKNSKEKLLRPEQFDYDTIEQELTSGVCSYLYQYVHREELNRGYTG